MSSKRNKKSSSDKSSSIENTDLEICFLMSFKKFDDVNVLNNLLNFVANIRDYFSSNC